MISFQIALPFPSVGCRPRPLPSPPPLYRPNSRFSVFRRKSERRVTDYPGLLVFPVRRTRSSFLFRIIASNFFFQVRARSVPSRACTLAAIWNSAILFPCPAMLPFLRAAPFFTDIGLRRSEPAFPACYLERNSIPPCLLLL